MRRSPRNQTFFAKLTMARDLQAGSHERHRFKQRQLAFGRRAGTSVGLTHCHTASRISASRNLRWRRQDRAYAGLAHGLRRSPVEETTLDRFARGRPVWVRSDAPPTFSSRELIHRARSRVGEDGYRLLTNNCEHFCEWCLHGEHRSYQVEAWVARPGRILHAAISLIAPRLSAPGRIGRRPACATAVNPC